MRGGQANLTAAFFISEKYTNLFIKIKNLAFLGSSGNEIAAARVIRASVMLKEFSNERRIGLADRYSDPHHHPALPD
ncbi:hypothetical protein ACSBLW_16315 [Thioclava sp. FR2]|uniref:hypothetical protein n=1 Tax=Thioclava sp. FR2 TaxID=3445780 RepID=UPI003EC09922